MGDRAPASWVRRAASLPARRPRATLAAMALALSAFAAGAPRLRFDPSTDRVFPDHHWAVETFEQFHAAFGGDETIFVALTVASGDVFEREVLAAGQALAREATRIDGVERSLALADVAVIRDVAGLGLTLTRPLPDDVRQASDAALARWRREVLATPYVERLLVSVDHQSAGVLLLLEQLEPGPTGAEHNDRIVAEVRALVERHARAAGLTAALAGSPLVKAEINQRIWADMLRFSGPLLLVATLVAWAVLGSLLRTGLVVGVLVVSVGLTLGAMGHLGIPIDTMTCLIPPLLLVIGVADALHLLVEQRTQAARSGPGATGADTVAAALRHVLAPCLLTSLTTAVGFASLLTSPVPPIRRFGVAAAVASLIAFAVTVTLVPACAALLAAPRPRGGGALRLDRLAALVVGRPRVGVTLGALAAVVFALGWARITPDTDFLRFFPEDSALRRDVAVIQARFVGIAPCELLVKGPPGLSRRPDVLRALLVFERALEERLPFVDMAFSVADMVEVAEQTRTGQRAIPDRPEAIDRLSALYQLAAGGEFPLERLVQPANAQHPGEEWLRVSVRAQAVGSRRMGALVRATRDLTAEHLAPLGVQAVATGTSVVFSQSADTIMRGQLVSFAWAFVVITAALSLALRSLPLGLLAAVPNLLPIVALGGAMGHFGIPFNSINSMVASIALGIAVDDTIHILLGFQRFQRDRPVREAVRETIAHEGAAVVSTSVVLLGGFAVLLTASFGPTVHFGALTLVAIGAALLGDLAVLPALLIIAFGDRVKVGVPVAAQDPPASDVERPS